MRDSRRVKLYAVAVDGLHGFFVTCERINEYQFVFLSGFDSEICCLVAGNSYRIFQKFSLTSSRPLDLLCGPIFSVGYS